MAAPWLAERARAEERAMEEGCKAIRVTSGVSPCYYAALGYARDGTYMMKRL